MELKHGFKIGDKEVKEFEVLPATAGMVLEIIEENQKLGDSGSFEGLQIVKRIKIEGLGERWNLEALKKMSVEDFNVLNEAISEFDANFTVSPVVL
jgi:hypothetical protein